MVQLIMDQSRLWIPARGDGSEHFVGTDQQLWLWTDGNSWIMEEASQSFRKKEKVNK